MKTAFKGMVMVLGVLCGACSDVKSRLPVDSGDVSLAECVVVSRLIKGFFGAYQENQKHRYGAFFILADPNLEPGFRQFMVGHLPRVEFGAKNMVTLGHQSYKDNVTGLPSIVIRLEFKSQDADRALVEAKTESMGGFVYHNMELGRTSKGWVIREDRVIIP